MSDDRFEIHLTIWRDSEHTLAVKDDLATPCEARGPTIDHALQFWLDERRRMSRALGQKLAGWDLPDEPRE